MTQRQRTPEAMTFRREAGHRLRDLRKSAGVRQEALAVALNRSRSSLSRLERGILVMTLEDAFRATEFLDSTIYDLIDLKVNP